MSKPHTLKDLMTTGDLTMGEARKLASQIFRDTNILDDKDVVPYDVTLPNLSDLPAHVQGFIIKAVLESKIGYPFSEEVEANKAGMDDDQDGYPDDIEYSDGDEDS